MNKKVIASTVLFGVLAVCGAAIAKPDAVTVFNAAAGKDGKKLPIYCVDTPEKKVAISFDAAWGDG